MRGPSPTRPLCALCLLVYERGIGLGPLGQRDIALERSFDFPPGVELWVPYALGEKQRQARGRWLGVVGRLTLNLRDVEGRDK